MASFRLGLQDRWELAELVVKSSDVESLGFNWPAGMEPVGGMKLHTHTHAFLVATLLN